VDVLLDAFALRLTEGYAAAAPALTRALELVLALDAGPDLEADWGLWLAGAGASQMIAQELWDAESWYAVAAQVAQFARETGALVVLQFGLVFLVVPHLLAGELATAARLNEEDRLIAEATGNPPVAYTATTLAAWRGQEAPATELIEATVQEATARGQGRLVSLAATPARCSATAWAVTTLPATRPGGPSSAIRWGTGPSSCLSWPRRRPGPVTSRWSGPRWTGCPSARP
jgi:hypothetical protein